MTYNFATATKITNYHQLSLEISMDLYRDINQIIDHFEGSGITIIESNNISPIHKALHQQIVEAIISGWEIHLIDIANVFNPHLLNDYYNNLSVKFDRFIAPPIHYILDKIHLSRPFQIHQCVSIIRKLANTLIYSNKTKKKLLVIVTNIASQFFDDSVKEQDPDYSINSIERFRFALGNLQQIAINGHIVLLTNIIEKNQFFSNFIGTKESRSLLSHSNTYLTIEDSVNQYTVSLKFHPYLEAHKKILEKIQSSRNRKNIIRKQSSLNGWF